MEIVGDTSAATALRASNDRFERLVAGVLDYGIVMLDPDGFITSWNAGAERMKLYTAQEIMGEHFSIFHPPDDVAGGVCERQLVTAARDGRLEEEGWRLRKDGSLFWANVLLTAMRDHDGKLMGFSQVTRDLTERRRAQKELHASDERLRLLIQSVKEYAIFMLDPEGRVATWNPGAQRLKGYAYEEIVGQHFSRFYPRSDVEAGKCEMELEVAQAEGSFEDEGFRVRKDGTQFWANVVITAMRDSDGQLLGFAKVTRDLSERRRHEEKRVALARAEEGRRIAEANQEHLRSLAESLRQARDKAEEVARLKDEFLATVSHELRTPLNAILGWGRLLQQGLEPDKASRAADTIVRNAIAQGHIIEDLLDMSRIVAGQLQLDADLISLNGVLAAALDAVRLAADAKGVELRAAFDPSPAMIKGDAARLQQVFWNLVANAVKFTDRGGEVVVTLQQVQSHVRIEVSDNGIGIDPGFLPHIFHRFTQQDASRSRRVGGLGLGLAIVKHLVELHGGTVEAHSEGLGAGASFTISIPMVADPECAQRSVDGWPQHQEIAYPDELRGLKVLVLDDEREAQDLVAAILSKGGAQVLQTSTAAEALEAVPTFQPDVIVSDIGMPDEDGYAFVRKLRALERKDGGRTPAVALTAYARADDRRAALVAGFQNHAAKPIEPQELVMVVANLAGRYS